jgi:predicted dehydrogenase
VTIPSIALIGVSAYGKIYLERVLHHADRGELAIRAATIINLPEETAAGHELQARGCVIYQDYRRMLADHRSRLDLVLIPTGIPWHKEMTVAALEAGANVLVEKPLTMDPEEIGEIKRAREASGRFVAVGFQQMFTAATARVHAMIQGGEIGRLTSMRGMGLWPRTEAYFQRNSWAGRIKVNSAYVWDSPLTNGLAHFLMLGLHWSQLPQDEGFEEVEAELYRAQGIESYDTAAVRWRSPHGVELFFLATHSCEVEVNPVLIAEGTRGRIVWTLEGGMLERPAAEAVPIPVQSETAARGEMFACVLRRLRNPAEAICTIEQAALHTRFMAAVHAGREITPVPGPLIRRRVGEAGAAQVAIAGIESDFLRAFAMRRLPSEAAAPWGQAASVALH